MALFVVVIALAFLQVWGSRNPLHRDAWFERWVKCISNSLPARLHNSWLSVLCFIGIPAICLWWFIVFLVGHSVWLLLPVSVVIVLYAFGRGEFRDIVRAYTQACYVEDWSVAIERAQIFGVDTRELLENDWASLNQNVFEQAAYRGFERMFGVLFWFFVLGPVAAFSYRLLVMYVDKFEPSNCVEQDSVEQGAVKEQEFYSEMSATHVPDSNNEVDSESGGIEADNNNRSESLMTCNDSRARIFLRYVEWPGSRLLALTFALTGNFSTTIDSWSKGFMDVNVSTSKVLNDICLGALSVSDEVKADCEVTRKELSLLTKLYTRTLWLWLALAAFFFLYA